MTIVSGNGLAALVGRRRRKPQCPYIRILLHCKDISFNNFYSQASLTKMYIMHNLLFYL